MIYIGIKKMENKWYLLKYIGETFGIDELTNGKKYYAISDSEFMYRVIDDSGDDYLYSKENPAPADESSKGGKWEVLESYDIKDTDKNLLTVSDTDNDIKNYLNKNWLKKKINQNNYNDKIDSYLRAGKVIMLKKML